MKVGLYGEKDMEEAGGGGKHEGWLVWLEGLGGGRWRRKA